LAIKFIQLKWNPLLAYKQVFSHDINMNVNSEFIIAQIHEARLLH